MTVNSSKGQAVCVYPSDGGIISSTSGPFMIMFQYFGLDDNLSVYIRYNDGVLSKLVLDTDYSVEPSNGSNGIWGRVVVKRVFSFCQCILIERTLKNDQSTLFSSQTVVNSSIEKSIDKLTMLIQDMDFRSRTLRIPDDEIIDSDELLLPKGLERNGYIYFENGRLELRLIVLNWDDINGKPVFAEVATSGSYNDLEDKLVAGDGLGLDENNNTFSMKVDGDTLLVSKDGVKGNYIGSNGIDVINNVISCNVFEAEVLNSARSNISIGNWCSVTYGSKSGDGEFSRFVVVADGSDKLSYSDNGVDWHFVMLVNAEDDVVYRQWKSAVWGVSTGVFVAIADGSRGVAVSSDGISWDIYEDGLPGPSKWVSVAYGNNIFVAISSDLEYAAYSDNGRSWMSSSSIDVYPVPEWTCVTFGGGRFVAIAGGSSCVAYSDDGVIWTVNKYALSEMLWSSVCYGNNKFVAIANSSRCVAISDNGIVWEIYENVLPDNLVWSSVTYGYGKFIAVAYNTMHAVISIDGVHWSSIDMPFNGEWRSIIYGGNKFVAVAFNSNSAAYLEFIPLGDMISSPEWDNVKNKPEITDTTYNAGSGIYLDTETNKFSVNVGDNAGNNRTLKVGDDNVLVGNYKPGDDNLVIDGNIVFAAGYNAGPGLARSNKDINNNYTFSALVDDETLEIDGGVIKGKYIGAYGIDISGNIISGEGLTYNAGDGLSLDKGDNNKFSVNVDNKTLEINGGVIKGKYTGGGVNVAIDNNTGVISVVETPYDAGEGIELNDCIFSAKVDDFTIKFNVDGEIEGNYVGSGSVLVSGRTIHGTNTTYSNGAGLSLSGNVFSVSLDSNTTDASTLKIESGKLRGNYKSGSSNVNITGNVITVTDSGGGAVYVPGENISIKGDIISSDVYGAKILKGHLSLVPYKEWRCVIYANNKFVAVGNGSDVIIYSSDGITWDVSSQLVYPTDPANWWKSVAYSSVYGFIAVASMTRNIAVSSDGVVWTVINNRLPDAANWYSISCGDNVFVAISPPYVNVPAGTIARSVDGGVSWDSQNIQNYDWSSITYGAGKFIAVANGSSNVLYSNDAGVSWNIITGALENNNWHWWKSVCYGAGKFVVVGGISRSVGISTDGITWSVVEEALPSSVEWISVTYGGGYFVAVAIASSDAAISVDGIKWFRVVMPRKDGWWSVAYGNGRFAAVAGNSSTMGYLEFNELKDIVNSNSCFAEFGALPGAASSWIPVPDYPVNTWLYYDIAIPRLLYGDTVVVHPTWISRIDGYYNLDASRSQKADWDKIVDWEVLNGKVRFYAFKTDFLVNAVRVSISVVKQ